MLGLENGMRSELREEERTPQSLLLFIATDTVVWKHIRVAASGMEKLDAPRRHSDNGHAGIHASLGWIAFMGTDVVDDRVRSMVARRKEQ